MRNEIKSLGRELLIRHGYRGLRFSDISSKLDITRANIHYHFGTKDNLIEEIIGDYTQDTLQVLQDIWSADTHYDHKVLKSLGFNKTRFLVMNPTGETNVPWSLISRMRLEADLLSALSKLRLREFSDHLSEFIWSAIVKADEGGEFAENVPIKDIHLQISIIIDSAGSITTDAGSFYRLEQLYLAHLRLVNRGYGPIER